MRCSACHRRLLPQRRCPRHPDAAPAGGGETTDDASLNRVAGYDALTLIGRGGFAEVYRAFDRERERRVAIKVALAARDARFERELSVLGALSAPLAPELYTIGDVDHGRRFAVMELLDGSTVGDWLAAAESPPPVDEAVRVASALARAIDTFHAAGYVHRDIKPENIFLRPSGDVTLIDFGLARLCGEADEEGATSAADLTGTGELVGTIVYMAPEQALGRRVIGPQVDRYAFAAVLFELVTGRPPFVGDAADVWRAVIWRRPPSVAELAELPAAVDAVFERALAKEPDARYPSAAAIVEAFAQARRESGVTGTASPRGSRLGTGSGTFRRSSSRQDVALLSLHGQVEPARRQQLLELHGGTLVRVGDAGFVAAFPRADLPGGLRAAEEVARALADGGARAFLHTAPVRVRRGAHGLMVLGRAIDARESWEALAHPLDGTRAVWITPEAEQQRAPAPVAMDEIAELTAKQPIGLWGREQTVATLRQRAADAFAGRGGRVALVVGEVGFGKSYLLRHLEHQLRGSGEADVVRLAAPSADRESARSLLEQLLHVALELDSERPTAAELRRHITERFDTDLARAATAPIARAFGLEVESDSVLVEEDAASARRFLALALKTALLARAGRRPLALLIDDLQWADYTALDVIKQLEVEEVAVPIWCCAASRPEFAGGDAAWSAAGQARVELDRLTEPAARAALTDLLHPVEFIPAEVLNRLVDMTGRVPLHLVEVAELLRRTGAIRQGKDAEAWFLSAEKLFELGATPLAERLAAQELHHLDDDLAQFARVCAVLEHTFTVNQLVALQAELDRALGFGELDASYAVAELVRRRLLTQMAGGYGWRHPMFCEALSATMPSAARVEVHRGALVVFGAGADAPVKLVAYHARGAGRVELAGQLFLALGQEAEAQYHYLEAEESYSAAVDCAVDDGPLRHRALLGRSRVRSQIGRFAAAEEDLDAALTHARGRNDRRVVGELLLEKATLLDWAQRYSEAAEVVARALSEGERAGDARLQVAAQLATVRGFLRRDQLSEAIPMLETVARRARGVGDENTRADALVLLGGVLAMVKELDRSEEVLGQVLKECADRGDVMHMAAAYGNRLILWEVRGDHERAEADARVLIRLAREHGHFLFERVAHHALAELLAWDGRLEEALELARRARDLEQRFIPQPGTEDSLLLARIHAARGEHQEAHRYLMWIAEHCDVSQFPPSTGLLFRMIELAGGEAEACEWQELIELAREHSLLNQRLEILLAYATWATARDRADDLAMCTAEALEVAQGAEVWERRFLALSGA